MPRKHRTGLSRLLPYAAERKGRVAVIALLASLSAAAPVVGWHFVRDAIDNGIEPGDEHRLLLSVVGYVTVNAAAWVLGTLTWLGLASVGQRMVLEPSAATSSSTSRRSRSATSRNRRPVGSSRG